MADVSISKIYRFRSTSRVVIDSDNATILDIPSGKYYLVTTVGATIASLLLDGSTVEIILDALETAFRQPRERLRRDTETFLQDLLSRQLCEIMDDHAGENHKRLFTCVARRRGWLARLGGR